MYKVECIMLNVLLLYMIKVFLKGSKFEKNPVSKDNSKLLFIELVNNGSICI